MNNKKNILEVDFSSINRVLLRVDFNIPLDISNGKISDNSRILASIPTIKYLLQQSCAILICSHFGRPNGNYVEELKLDIISSKLSELLGQDVTQLDDCIGIDVEEFSKKMQPGEIAVLQNLRFHSGELKNCPNFSQKLSFHGDLYINDAFGTAHRSHASNVGVADLFEEKYYGLLMEKELHYLNDSMQEPICPLTVVMGGAKIKGKIELIENFLNIADNLLIGGALSFPFLKAKGFDVHSSLIDDEGIKNAKRLLEYAKNKNKEIIFTSDIVTAA